MKNIYEVLKQKEGEYSTLMVSYRQMGESVSKLGQEINAIQLTVQLLADAQDQTIEEQKNMSQPQMLRAILAEHGGEMYLPDILTAVEKKFHKKLSPKVVAAVIFRYAKRGSIFYKSQLKPNTWGLLEFNGNPYLKQDIFSSSERKPLQEAVF